MTIASLALPLSLQASAEPNWAMVDKRTDATYRVANWGILGGITASLVGELSAQPTLSTSGDVVFTAALATATGATLRQHRSIAARGVKSTAVWGYSSWALQAAAVGLHVGSQLYMENHGLDDGKKVSPDEYGAVIGMGLGSLACSVGALLTASKQHRENAYHRSTIGRASARRDARPDLTVQPILTTNGVPGLAALATF